MKILNRNHSGVLTFVALCMLVLIGGLGVFINTQREVLAESTNLFEVHKRADVNQAPIGGEVQYTIVLTNVSGGPVTPVVTDTLDHSLAYVDGSATFPQGVYLLTPGAGEIVFGFGRSVQHNEVVTLTFDVEVLAGTLQIGSVFTNTAMIDDQTSIYSTNPVVLSVGQPPTARIDDPITGQIIEEDPETIKEIRGVVWDTYDPAPFPSAPIMYPIDNFGGAGNYSVRWSSTDSSVDNYVLQEAKNSLDDADFKNIYGGEATEQFLTGRTSGVYYYRVKAYNASGRPSSWSNVVSATVTSRALAGERAYVPQEVEFALMAAPVVSVSINGGAWQAATLADQTDYWSWSYDWTLPEEEGVPYTIQARAADSGGNLGPVDTVTVTVLNATRFIYFPVVLRRWPPLPYAPTLSVTSAPDDDGNFALGWVYGSHPDVPANTGYTLQEATNVDFTGTVEEYNISETSKSFTTKSPGTYYYRVRAINKWGYGQWSNTVEVVIVEPDLIYYFDTSGDTEGWGIKRYDSDSATGYLLMSRSGKLYTAMVGRFDWMVASPMEVAPTLPYTIKGRVDIVDNEEINDRVYTAKSGMSYGIIFGGNGGTPCPANVNTGINTGCLEHYYRLLVIYNQGDGNFTWNLKRIDYHDPHDDGKGKGVSLVDYNSVQPHNALDWNEWTIHVSDAESQNIKVYLGSKLLAQVTDHTYINDRYFGVWFESPDFGDVAAKWDWIRVEN